MKVGMGLGLHTISRRSTTIHHNMCDENGTPRVFCPDRYADSQILPTRMEAMIRGNFLCWRSTDRNQVSHFGAIDSSPAHFHALQDGEYNLTFFHLHPPAAKDEGGNTADDADVELLVVSAYTRNVNFSKLPRRLNLHTVLRKCAYNKRRLP